MLRAFGTSVVYCRARLQQSKCFVFQNVSDQMIVFVPADFDTDMVLVDAEHKLRAQQKVLQVLQPRPTASYN